MDLMGLKLVRVGGIPVHEVAARSLQRVLSETSLSITKSHLNPLELMSSIRIGAEQDFGFWGYSGHLYGLSLDIDNPPVEILKAHGWVAIREDPFSTKWSAHFTYYGPDWQNYERGIENGNHRPEVNRVLDILGDALGRQTPPTELFGVVMSSPLLLREGLLAFQRAWQIPATGELDLRTRVALLAFQIG